MSEIRGGTYTTFVLFVIIAAFDCLLPPNHFLAPLNSDRWIPLRSDAYRNQMSYRKANKINGSVAFISDYEKHACCQRHNKWWTNYLWSAAVHGYVYVAPIRAYAELILTCSLSTRTVFSAHAIRPLTMNSCMKMRSRSWSLSVRYAPCCATGCRATAGFAEKPSVDRAAANDGSDRAPTWFEDCVVPALTALSIDKSELREARLDQLLLVANG